jgi:hypothetical protein
MFRPCSGFTVLEREEEKKEEERKNSNEERKNSHEERARNSSIDNKMLNPRFDSANSENRHKFTVLTS